MEWGISLHTFVEYFASLLCVIGVANWVTEPKRAAVLSASGCYLFVYWSLTLDPPAYPVAALDFIIGSVALNNMRLAIKKERRIEQENQGG